MRYSHDKTRVPPQATSQPDAKLVQVLAGRIYDEAYEAGRREGHRQGVDSVLLEQEEILRRTYDKGATEANHFGSAFFTAAACCALEDTYKFGRIRLKRFFDRLGYLLKTELTPARMIKRCAKRGIQIEYADELGKELEDIND